MQRVSGIADRLCPELPALRLRRELIAISPSSSQQNLSVHLFDLMFSSFISSRCWLILTVCSNGDQPGKYEKCSSCCEKIDHSSVVEKVGFDCKRVLYISRTPCLEKQLTLF